MKPLGSRRSICLLAGLLSAFLAAGLLAPSEARAGCGDYVTPASRSAGHVPTASAEHTPQMPLPANHSPITPREGHGPCQGTSCSRGSLPPLQPVPSAPPVVERWSCLTSLLIPTGAKPANYLSDHSVAHPVRRGQDIFHPPRSFRA